MPRFRIAAAVVAATLIGAGGCGTSAPRLTAGSTTTSSSGSLVVPASATGADRTITITAINGLKWDPTSVSVHAGETVTFKVVNTATVIHEFDVGDAAFQAQHETEMQAMPAGMVMADEPTGIVVNPGQTKMITLRFPRVGTVIYGCHQAGHYAAGMKGTIQVS